ncbi:hypothetical protein [Streptomyces sp. NPDC048845]|uniref:hypothetical protein n=1 Tax=Streptomyces sp. NPDC048845 TaxID=3155390 RepID=UPI00341C0D4F
MSSSVPPLPKVELFVDHLERLLVLPPGRRGPAPLVLLEQEGPGREAEELADGLCARFRVGGRARVPYAQVAGAPSGPRRERIGDLFQKLAEELERNRPGGFGRLRLPQFELMCTIIETDLTQRQPAVQARELRDRCYAERRKDSNVLKALEVISGGDRVPTGVPALLWYWLRQPLFNVLPRWLYGRLQERRMTRRGSWYRQWAGLQKGTGFFRDARGLAGTAPPAGTVQVQLLSGSGSPSPAGASPGGGRDCGEDGGDDDGGAAELRDRTVDVLLRALLTDLEAAFRRPRLSPWGRRRGSRFALVLPQIGAYPEWTPRLLRQFPPAVEQTGCTGAVLVAAVPSGGDGAEGFVDAAGTLKSWAGATGRGLGRVLRVRVAPHAPDPAAARWLNRYPEVQPGRTHSDAAPRVEALVGGVAVLAILSGTAVYAVDWALTRNSDACLGGASAGTRKSGDAPPDWPDRSPEKLYQEVRGTIERQNKEADRAAGRPGAVVRTVVYLGVPVTAGSWQEAMYSGAVPELRGIALSQAELNRAAAKDEGNKVYLRVRFEDAGPGFEDAPDVARRITREIAREGAGGNGGAEEIMGVVGLGQSRHATLETRDELGDNGLPMIGTVATAEEMLRHRMYRQVAPDNGREARIAAGFALRGNVVETEPGVCAPAERAVVIADPDDVYSANLSTRFTEEFQDSETIWYSTSERRSRHSAQGRDDVEWVQNLSEMAASVCAALKEERRTVVYWAARANEFGAFLNEFGSGTGCNGRVSVLGGNDLTNAVVDVERPSERHPGVRLYYAAHALPASYPPNVRGEVFRNDYAAAYGNSDPWREDGRAPLAWDALQVLGAAVNAARQNAGDAEFGRGTVQAALKAGVGGTAGLRGASGSLAYGESGEVPRDKRLLILHHTDSGSKVVLECGALDNGVEKTEWGPDGAYDCPRDAD